MVLAGLLKRSKQPRTREMKSLFSTQLYKSAISTVVLAGIFLGSSPAFSAVVTYANRTSFEAAILNDQTDTFNSSSYQVTNSAATMKSLSVASIGYESTGWEVPNWNIVVGGQLCWGCNGSGRILLDDTTIGTSSGVFGFGVDIQFNRDYDAFVTFGDNSTQNFDLGSGAGFFALSSDLLIKTVHFGLTNGGTTTDSDSSVVLDNVTIGNEGTVPEPATYTLMLASLGLLGFLSRNKKAKSAA